MTQSIAADPKLYVTHFVKLTLEKRPGEAVIAAERSLALNPSFVAAYHPLCVATGALGHPERSVELAEKAMRLSPRDPLMPAFYWQKACHYSCQTAMLLPLVNGRAVHNFPQREVRDIWMCSLNGDIMTWC
jgi:hypothetical protein